jgi:hypothetical protein
MEDKRNVFVNVLNFFHKKSMGKRTRRKGE